MGEDAGSAASTAGVSAERIAKNEAIFRDANEGIRESAERHAPEMLVPFVCECADPECRDLLRVSLDGYREVRAHPRNFLIAPGHEAAAQGWGKVVAHRGSYSIVAKIGHAGVVAEQLHEP